VTIYLDHAATTPLRDEAREAWLAAQAHVGNPSSVHGAGRSARAVVEDARERVAAALGAHPTEVIFTSGATEANNLAILGASAEVVVTSPLEHHSALDPARWLATAGAARVIETLDFTALPERAGKRGLVSLHWVNNETGAVFDVPGIAVAAHAAGYTMHSDAVQAVPYLDVSFAGSGLDTMAVSAHKLGGPVGVGALLVRRETRLAPGVYGGGQQRFRSGTLDAAGTAAFAAALDATVAQREAESARLARLRDRLIEGMARLGEVMGPGPAGSAPHIVNAVFDGARSEVMIFALDQEGIEVSSGSACTSGVVDASHVLLALGRTQAEAEGALRVSMGRTTSDDDVSALLEALPSAVERSRVAHGMPRHGRGEP